MISWSKYNNLCFHSSDIIVMAKRLLKFINLYIYYKKYREGVLGTTLVSIYVSCAQLLARGPNLINRT